MCGIIGYITTQKDINDVLICGLKKLEYRGYDSAGICLHLGKNFYIHKSIGQIYNLQKDLKQKNSTCGIAHTRWATHGQVNLNNTHPHTNQAQDWCVVHNGIIENYLSLKTNLQKQGVEFYSDTDTEVIPNLLKLQSGNTLQKNTKSSKQTTR